MLTWIKSNLNLVGIILAAVVLLIALGSIRSCMNKGQDAAQAKQDVKSSDAYAGAAKEAVETVASRASKDADIAIVVAAATMEIDNAKDPIAARVAVINAVCSLRAYHDRPECKVLNNATGNVAKPR